MTLNPSLTDIEFAASDSTTQPPGIFLTAIPHPRRLFILKTLLRAIALIVAPFLAAHANRIEVSPGLVYPVPITPYSYLTSWEFFIGVPLASMSLAWTLCDIIAMFWRHGWKPWERPMRDAKGGIDSETWGHPGWHVAAHLVLFLIAAVGFIGEGGGNLMSRNNMAEYLSLFGILLIVHFVLFVAACNETDNRTKDLACVIFLPHDGFVQEAYAPPSTPIEMLRPKKLRVGYIADHLTRLVPVPIALGGRGTVHARPARAAHVL